MSAGDPRHELAAKRLRNVLRAHGVASDRILEQKISDGGPGNQRIDPHVLTSVRQSLVDTGLIVQVDQSKTSDVPWYHLAETPPATVKARLAALTAVQLQTQAPQFTSLVGQALEIAVFRALLSQSTVEHFGNFVDLDDHDDSTLYKKSEPPTYLSGRQIPDKKKLDFLLLHTGGRGAGVEVKNTRQWFYPNREEIREMLLKCCALDVVPVLIARRIHYSTFSVLNPCGVVIHQMYNQLYPSSANALAAQVREKTLLGYHDVRVGNQPDARLLRFIHTNLPQVLPSARSQFDAFKDLLWSYAIGDYHYVEFAARVKRRVRGEPEDGPGPPQTEEY